jgi:hypothetical protein
MENLNGHETGNGGYCQGDTYCNSPFLDPTINLKNRKTLSFRKKSTQRRTS